MDISSLNHGCHSTFCPRRNLAVVCILLQNIGIGLIQAIKSRQHRKNFLSGDGRFRAQHAAIPRKCAHLHCFCHIVIVPSCGGHVCIAGKWSPFHRTGKTIENRRHFCPFQCVIGTDLSVVTTKQAIANRIGQSIGCPVIGEIRKVRRRSRQHRCRYSNGCRHQCRKDSFLVFFSHVCITPLLLSYINYAVFPMHPRLGKRFSPSC